MLRGTGFMVETGGGFPPGAARAAARLVEKNVEAIISFGLAGGLNPALPPGALLVPRCVLDGVKRFCCDNALLEILGGANCGAIMAGQRIVQSVAEKSRLFQEVMADGVDLESGSVARVAASAGLPFAVLRAVADPAERDLPPAALIALNSAGDIKVSAVLASVFRQPGQIPVLLAIARDAAKARRTLVERLERIV